ncbi:MAG: hypothetical protein HGA78_09760, partial [Nitrospirales bacterium]|nr:hypothetical protein [Nitrospirales bacterium]
MYQVDGTAFGELEPSEERKLPVTEEAVKLYRALSSANPQAFTPDLAMSLDNLGVRLTDFG